MTRERLYTRFQKQISKLPYSTVIITLVSNATYGHQATIIILSMDQYGRSLGWVYYDDKNINKELLKAGLAWHYRRYSKDDELQALEDEAKAKKIGLWKDGNPIPPWYWRRAVRG